MITLLKKPGIPPFSKIIYDKRFEQPTKKASASYYPIGQVIRRSLLDFQNKFPKISILRHVIMPDHIHFILKINEKIDEHLGRYIARFKRMAFQKAILENVIADFNKSLFLPNYNDQYLNPGRSLKVLSDYIELNPYRYWVKTHNNNFFTNGKILSINGVNCRVYGNLSLLSQPFVTPVVYHRKFSEIEWEGRRHYYSYTIYNGGVITGPFVNEKEKEILYEAIEAQGKIIHFNYFPNNPRWKPMGKLFDLCAIGNLLLVHPLELDACVFERIMNKRDNISRYECLFMNSLAEKLSISPIAGIRL